MLPPPRLKYDGFYWFLYGFIWFYSKFPKNPKNYFKKGPGALKKRPPRRRGAHSNYHTWVVNL